jgi:hypothetical protein
MILGTATVGRAEYCAYFYGCNVDMSAGFFQTDAYTGKIVV